jgi:hypothetical protein
MCGRRWIGGVSPSRAHGTPHTHWVLRVGYRQVVSCDGVPSQIEDGQISGTGIEVPIDWQCGLVTGGVM